MAPAKADAVVEGVRLHALADSSSGSRLRRVAVTARAACRQAATLKPQIVHLHDPELLLWARGLHRSGAAVIFDMHEDWTANLASKSWLPSWLRAPAAWLARVLRSKLLGKTAIVYAETSYAARHSTRQPSVVVLNYPIVKELEKVRASATDPGTEGVTWLGYLGRVAAERGSLLTLDVLRLLRARGLTVGWECVGAITGSHRRELEEQFEAAGTPNVNLRGQLPPDRGWEIMAGCDIGLAVLLPSPNFIESYPTKLFEYMGLGIPVVTSDFPLYREVVENTECGLCADPTDPAAVADAVSQLIADPAQARAMGENGRHAVREVFNWDGEQKKLLSLYAELLA